MLRLDRQSYLQMIGHAYDGLPDEACGLMAGNPVLDRVERFYATRNAAESSRVYTVDPKDHLRADRDAEDHGVEIIGVMHSHTHTDAYPSPTDVAQAPDPDLALRHRLAQAGGSGAALLPHRRGSDRRGARRGRGAVDSLPMRSASGRSDPRGARSHGRLHLGARHDRQHADDRRQPAQPQPGRAHPRQDGGPEPGRVGQGPHRAQDDRRGRGRRHADAGPDASSSRRRATPASPWP